MQIVVGDKLYSFSKSYKVNAEKYKQTELTLAKIPLNATVTAETYLVPHLYKVHNLYMYPAKVTTEYFVIDNRNGPSPDKVKKDELIAREGYKLIYEGGLAKVYKR